MGLANLNILVSAGEVSGDLYAGQIIKALKEKTSAENIDLKVWGMGGEKLAKRNAEIIQDSSNLGIIGGIEIVKNLLFFKNLLDKFAEEIKLRQPDIALLIDYPGFNLRLCEIIRQNAPNCRIIYFVAPQVWAWGQSRIKKLPGLIDRLLVILPFEEELHKKAGSSVKYVGNPSAYYMNHLKDFDKTEIFDYFKLDPKKATIGIFPGSRNREIDFMLPIFLETAKILKAAREDIQFILVKSSNIKEEKFQKIFKKYNISQDMFISITGKSHFILKSIDLAWLTSGTVTLECACAGTPLILGYKEFPPFWKIFELISKVKNIGLPNIVAEEKVCPELLQEDCIPENWLNLTERFLSSREQWQNMKNELYEKIYLKLQPDLNPFENVSEEILKAYKLNMLCEKNKKYIQKRAEENSKQKSR